MQPARLLFSITASLLILFGSHAARAVTTTHTWLGGEVSITTPVTVFYGRPFNISFSVDSSTLAPGSVLAFKTFLDASDTIEVATTSWEYTFISDAPAWNFTLWGVLGDANTPITYDVDGYSIRLFDPVIGERTWIWTDYNDQVVWTLHNFVLLDDTSFALTLDEYFAGPTTFEFDVTGSPEFVPALPAAALMGTALCILAAAAHPTARRRLRRRHGDGGARPGGGSP
jgi:hypothetical protein